MQNAIIKQEIIIKLEKFTNLRIYTMKLEEIKNVHNDIIYNYEYEIWNGVSQLCETYNDEYEMEVFTTVFTRVFTRVFTTVNIEMVWVQLCEHQPVMLLL